MTRNESNRSSKVWPVGEENRRVACRNRRLFLACGAMALTLAITLAFGSAARAESQASAAISGPVQTQPVATDETPGRNEGNYNVQQSIEFGYRDTLINGNLNNYDTFENFQTGLRLFDYTLDLHSINHQGILFDNLSFANFGYGGDPNDMSRLRIEKNKWYDFRVLFRRDKNYWNYNLLANPLNPTSFTPPVPIVNSPHALDLVRRMEDYDLTLFPQSRIRFRLGYSRNVNTGPAATSVEGGTEPGLLDNLTDTTNAYRMGVDYKGLSKTTLSFDEFLTYSKIDSNTTDNNLAYQLANGTPVDLGLVFTGTSPCAAPITVATTHPPTVTPNCNGYLSYSAVQNPRSSFPTERFSFQSGYIKNLAMNGSASYSSGSNSVADYNEVLNGWASRTITRESTTAGPTNAKRISANVDWSGEYRLTDKLSLLDEIAYENWRIPSMWATADTNLFAPPAVAGQVGLTLPISTVTPATFASVCPTAPYNGPLCPQHNSSSGADVTNEIVARFLGQNIRTNTVELKYDMTKRISARVGYLYTARTITDYSSTWDTGEIYLPGGSGGTKGLLQGGTATGNYYNAARGDCAVVAGALPSGCALNPNGSIQEGSPSNLVPEAGNSAERALYLIHENAALLGIAARPTDTLRVNADLMFGYNDNSFTRISPRQVQSYKVRAIYNPKPWATVTGVVDIHENRDNVSMVDNLEHGRSYSFVTTLAHSSALWVDFGYTYMDIYTQTEICFPDTGSTVFTTPCPIANATSPLGTLAYYASQEHYAYGQVMWKPYKRVTAMVGYSGTIVRGNTTFLNAMDPTGTLDFNYLKPSASLAVDLYKGLVYKTAWNYYGYNDHGIANPVGLAPLPSQNFDGNIATFSLRYLF